MQLGLTTDDSILRCTYLDSECNAESFRLYMHPSYWNCYTIKAISEQNAPNLGCNNVGSQNGISLLLVSHNPIKSRFYDHLSKTGNTRGIKVSVHGPGTDPTISETGIDILPGMSTSFGLIQKEHHRLSHPYADCREKKLLNVSNQGFSMNTELCYKACVANYILNKCNCVSIRVDLFLGDMLNDNVTYCLHGSIKFGHIAYIWIHQISNQMLKC